MNINNNTKISELIKANSDSIETIAAIAKPFRKLKNPLLRRVMASRVTIKEAATMGGCSLEDFKTALEPLGFVFSNEEFGETSTPEDNTPQWLDKLNDTQKVYFDVREIIAKGDDPLKTILHQYQTLEPGHAICIINSFIPYPLINLLGNKGVQSHVETVDEKLYHTWFFKSEDQAESTKTKTTENSRITMHDAESFGQLMEQQEAARLQKIDVRPLPMPQPMETILKELSTLAEDQLLYIDHKRVPLHLLEALEDQPYEIHVHEAGEGDVKMLIKIV